MFLKTLIYPYRILDSGCFKSMDTECQLRVPEAKKARYETNFSLCIICQVDTSEPLVDNPSAHEKLLTYISDRATYGDGKYPDIQRRLEYFSHHDIQAKCATWHRKCYQDTVHRKCYQDTVHRGHCNRAKERYERMIAAKDSQRSVDSHLSGSRTFTRSQSAPYNSYLCFFCEDPGSYKYPLHRVAIQNAGISVKEAIEKSGNERLRVKLSTALDPIDIRYHKHCWATEVTHVLRKTEDTNFTITSVADKIAADIEFLCMLETRWLCSQHVFLGRCVCKHPNCQQCKKYRQQSNMSQEIEATNSE